MSAKNVLRIKIGSYKLVKIIFVFFDNYYSKYYTELSNIRKKNDIEIIQQSDYFPIKKIMNINMDIKSFDELVNISRRHIELKAFL